MLVSGKLGTLLLRAIGLQASERALGLSLSTKHRHFKSFYK